MAVDANVAIKIGGDSTTLRSDLKKAQLSLDAFEKKAKVMQTRMVAVGVAAVAAGAAMTTALYKNQSAIIDRLAKTADALGVTTENLQALRHMAGLAGVESTELDVAIQRMSKGLGDAALKGGAAADALENIGVNIADVVNLSADEQMEILAEALASVESHAEKASLASDLFGRNGLRMLKVLNQLEDEGLQPTIDSIDAMGAALSRVDAAAVEDANDSMAIAMEAASGLAKELTVELAPIVQAVADAFTNWVTESGGLRAKLEELEPIFNALITAGKMMALVYGIQMSVAFALYVKGAAKTIAANAMMAKSMVSTITVTKALRTALALLGGPVGIIAAVATSLIFFRKKSEETTESTDDLKEANYDLGQSYKDLSKIQAAAHIVDLEQAMGALKEKMSETKSAMKDMSDSGMSIIPNDVFDFDVSELWPEEVFIKAQANLEEMENQYNAMNSRLGKLGLQAEHGAFLTVTDEDVEESSNNMLTMEEKQKAYYERQAAAQTAAKEKIYNDTVAWNKKTDEEEEEALQNKEDRATAYYGILTNLSSLMEVENKKLFNIGKAAAIAQATVDGISATISAYKFGAQAGGPILGAAFATSAAVSTGAMISQLASQSYSSGTTSTSTSSTTSTASTGVNAGQTMTVEGFDSGSFFSGDAISTIASELLEFQRNGGTVYLA